jgi:hypothetical protein
VAELPGNGGEVAIELNVRAPTVLEQMVLTNQAGVADPDEPGDPPDNNTASEDTKIQACFDVTGDGRVTIEDVLTIINVYFASVGDPEYDLLYDFDGDGIVTIVDVLAVLNHYFQFC